jgi:hypothetical protein
MGKLKNGYNICVGKLEGKRPCGRPTRRWDENIAMNLGKWVSKVWTGSI